MYFLAFWEESRPDPEFTQRSFRITFLVGYTTLTLDGHTGFRLRMLRYVQTHQYCLWRFLFASLDCFGVQFAGVGSFYMPMDFLYPGDLGPMRPVSSSMEAPLTFYTGSTALIGNH